MAPPLLISTYIICITAALCCSRVGSSSPTPATTQQLSNGFRANPDPTVSTFQPILTDSTGNYSFGFLRVNPNQVVLAVIHAASFETMWVANATRSPKWSDRTHLIFNGDLVLSDSDSAAVWSTGTRDGQRAFLSNTFNLQIQTAGGSALWQSLTSRPILSSRTRTNNSTSIS